MRLLRRLFNSHIDVSSDRKKLQTQALHPSGVFCYDVQSLQTLMIYLHKSQSSIWPKNRPNSTTDLNQDYEVESCDTNTRNSIISLTCEDETVEDNGLLVKGNDQSYSDHNSYDNFSNCRPLVPSHFFMMPDLTPGKLSCVGKSGIGVLDVTQHENILSEALDQPGLKIITKLRGKKGIWLALLCRKDSVQQLKFGSQNLSSGIDMFIFTPKVFLRQV
ncbi:MAG: hypothetical protein MHPSP_000953 [Paramarteilia canceri]